MGHDRPIDNALAALAANNRELRDGEAGAGREDRGRTVDIQFLREIMYSLEAVSIGTHQLLYFAAMKYAKNNLEPRGEDIEEVVAALDEMFDAMNVGGLAVTGRGDGEVHLALHENAVACHGPQSDRPLCYFLAGYIAGYLEHCLDANYVVNESHCSVEGGDACAFTARER